MPSSRKVQESRREMIRTILMDEETPVGDQRELVELLKAKGFAATQPSVSRDLRDLGALRIQGRYQILDWLQEDDPSPVREARGLVTKIMSVEESQILVVTKRGAGIFVGDRLEESGWEDIIGTVVGYSSVHVFTQNKFFRDLVFLLLERYLDPAREEEEPVTAGE